MGRSLGTLCLLRIEPTSTGQFLAEVGGGPSAAFDVAALILGYEQMKKDNRSAVLSCVGIAVGIWKARIRKSL